MRVRVGEIDKYVTRAWPLVVLLCLSVGLDIGGRLYKIKALTGDGLRVISSGL